MGEAVAQTALAGLAGEKLGEHAVALRLALALRLHLHLLLLHACLLVVRVAVVCETVSGAMCWCAGG